MPYETFVHEVRQRTGLDTNGEAIDAAEAVLQTLFECLPGALSSEVVSHLPCALHGIEGAAWTLGESLTVPEFLQRVSERESGTEAAAFCHSQAVFQMLGAALGLELLERVRAEIPPAFDEFWGADPARVHMHQMVG